MEIALTILVIGLLVFLAHGLTALFTKTQIPDVLILFGIGLVLGPITHLLAPEVFGKVGPVFTTITLVIILFESGLGLDIRSLLTSLKGALLISFLFFIVTTLIVAGIAWALTGLNLFTSLMLGCILGGTSSAVVIPIVQQLKPGATTSNILIIESALTDVFCIIFTLGLLEAVKIGEFELASLSIKLSASFLVALLIGLAGGVFWSMLLNRIRHLQNSIFTTPAFVFILFGVAEILGFSGAIASLAFGFTLSNTETKGFRFLQKYIRKEPISLSPTEKAIFSEVVFLLKTFFFIYIGMSMQFKDMWLLFIGLVMTLAIFFMRPFFVRLLASRQQTQRDLTIESVLIPKGLAAAVLATVPLQAGIAGGETIQNITYSVVLISIVVASILVLLIERTPVKKLYFSLFKKHAIPT
ncbi:MAG: sodium:proton exchanger [Bacteroidetes bacterium]|nr:sodium:proton exchanger [Bacteroidota bacterium]